MSIDIFGDAKESLKINNAAICRSTRDNNFWFMKMCEFCDSVVIKKLRVATNPVGYHFKPSSRKIDGTSVRQMATMAKVHGQDGVITCGQGKQCRKISTRARMGLHIGRLCGKD